MTDGSARGFWMSATLHGALAAALFLFGYVLKKDVTDVAKVFELVGGEGDNFMAREAPALGTAAGQSLDVPVRPEPKAAPPVPARAEPAPVVPTVAPAPTVIPASPATAPPVPDFQKKLVRELNKAEAKAKREIAKTRAAEKKRLEEEKKRLEDEKKREDDQKRLTKDEFDKATKVKSAAPPAKDASRKIAKIDTAGIVKGMEGGSTNNKAGGAGGKALTNDNDDVLAAYDALFKQRLRSEFEPPPGLSDSLKATIEVRSQVDGTLTAARLVKTSGSNEFDQAVLEAVRRVRMPARPDRKSELIEFVFAMRERSEG